MKAFFLITGSILRRLLSRKRLLGMLILTCAPALLMLALTAGSDRAEALATHDTLLLTMLLPLIFPLVAIITASGALGEERRAATLPDLLLKPVPRGVIAAAATAAALAASLVFLLGGAAADWLVLGFRTGDFAVGLGILPAAAVQAAGFTALFVPLGLIMSRAVLIGLAYLILWEITLAAILDGIRSTSLYRIAVSAWADWGTPSTADAETLDAILGRVESGGWGAVAKVAVMLAVSVAATWLITAKREMISGSGEE